MWLTVAFAVLGLIAGCIFLGLCVSEGIWREGGTPPILLWVGGTYGLALAFLALCIITFLEV